MQSAVSRTFPVRTWRIPRFLSCACRNVLRNSSRWVFACASPAAQYAVVASLPNSPSCAFSLSSRTWACINALLWLMVSKLFLSISHASAFDQVSVHTDVAPWNAPLAFCICLAPLAVTYALYTLSNNVVKFDRSIDDLEGTKYEFKKL